MLLYKINKRAIKLYKMSFCNRKINQEIIFNNKTVCKYSKIMILILKIKSKIISKFMKKLKNVFVFISFAN